MSSNRHFFSDCTEAITKLEWKSPDVDGLVQFLVTEKGFKCAITLLLLIASIAHACLFHSEERVRKGAEKLNKFLNAKQQGRLDGFFTVKAKPPSPKKGDASKGKGKADGKGTKRKVRFHNACPRRCNRLILLNRTTRRKMQGRAKNRRPRSR